MFGQKMNILQCLRLCRCRKKTLFDLAAFERDLQMPIAAVGIQIELLLQGERESAD